MEWQPTPVSLPGESHGQRNLAGYSPWCHKESDTIKQLRMHIFLQNGGIHVKINPIPIKSIETNGDIFDMQCIFVVYFCKRISQVTQW